MNGISTSPTVVRSIGQDLVDVGVMHQFAIELAQRRFEQYPDRIGEAIDPFRHRRDLALTERSVEGQMPL